MSSNDKIRVGITHGDINGVGYELILKAFSDPVIYEFCTPIVYGSPKVATYHRKAINSETNFSIINQARDAEPNRLNILTCVDDELKVELGRPSIEAGKAALDALRQALNDYMDGQIDVLVTAPVYNQTIQSDEYNYLNQAGFVQQEAGEGQTPLTILVKDDLRIALATDDVPLNKIMDTLNADTLKEKLLIFHQSLVEDFGLDNPRIAVLSLNPHAGQHGQIGLEEQKLILPVMNELDAEGVLCFGPYSVDGLMGSGNYMHFDGIMAMYYDQGAAPFKSLTEESGVRYTAGLPIVHVAPAHGVAYDITGQGLADESGMRNAIYLAIDILRNRIWEEEIHANPLRKQYFDKKDDSYKLKLDAPEEETL